MSSGVITGHNHTRFTESDLERSVVFYTEMSIRRMKPSKPKESPPRVSQCTPRRTSPSVCYFVDPDGITLELNQIPSW